MDFSLLEVIKLRKKGQTNKQIAENSDVIVAFIPDGIKSNGTDSTINYAKKFNKKYVIIS